MHLRFWEAERLRRGPIPEGFGEWGRGSAWRWEANHVVLSGGASLVSEQREAYGSGPAPSAAPAFVPPRLLDGDVGDVPRAELAHLLETEVLRLGACEARLDLELGQALSSCKQAVVQELGFSSMDSYCPEVLGFARRVASELITLAKRLALLPRMREMFLAGALARSRVRIAASVATPETDLRWTLACLRSSTRTLEAQAKDERRRLAAAAKRPAPSPLSEDASAEEMTRVRVRGSADEISFVEHVGIPMLQSVLGVSGPLHVLFEALAADTLAELGPEGEEPVVAPVPAQRRSKRSPIRGSGGACEAKSHDHDEKDARRALHRWRLRLGGLPAVAWPVVPETMTSPDEIHARLQQLSMWRHGLDWQRARLLALVHERGLWRERGHASFHEWHDHRLGLSPKQAQGLIALSKKVEGLPALDASWRAGRVDAACASLLQKVASPETEDDWLDLTREASKKRVEMEVAAQLAERARFGWSRALELTGGRPQRDKAMHALLARWDDTMERRLRRQRARLAASPGKKEPAPDSPYDLDGRLADRGACEKDLLAGPPLGRKRALLAFDAPPDVAALINEALRQVARDRGWALDAGGCLVVMLDRFAETHVIEGLAERGLRAKILRRDGWRCFMPRCRARKHLDVHHVVFRSRGGGNAQWNLITLCQRCHRLLHEGKLNVTGLAPSGLLVRMGRAAPGRLLEWFREGIRQAHGPSPESWAA